MWTIVKNVATNCIEELNSTQGSLSEKVHAGYGFTGIMVRAYYYCYLCGGQSCALLIFVNRKHTIA